MAKKHNKKLAIVRQWNQYIQDGALENWQRLLKDLGLEGEFRSKNQCRKALKKIWVNIYDFLEAVKVGKPVPRFKTEAELSHYTLRTDRVFPKKHITKGSPLANLMAHIVG
ncbi:uncharacterized protein PG998_002209 [Apiospora kogelbergensis]|uniref:Integrase n=1 Tax=Apiospora kogelbergensis TaxID=1337665 RepID=A0AAW0Q4K3_9PEZI